MNRFKKNACYKQKYFYLFITGCRAYRLDNRRPALVLDRQSGLLSSIHLSTHVWIDEKFRIPRRDQIWGQASANKKILQEKLFLLKKVLESLQLFL